VLYKTTCQRMLAGGFFFSVSFFSAKMLKFKKRYKYIDKGIGKIKKVCIFVLSITKRQTR